MSKHKIQPGAVRKLSGAQSIPELLQQAVSAHQAGQVEQALGLYRRVLALEPTNPDALNFSGMAHVQQGDPDKAVRLLQKATAKYSDFAEAYQNLGVALKMLGRFKEALKAYRYLVRLKPHYAQGHNDLGIVLRQLGRHDEAMAAYSQALQLAPDYAEAHTNLGNLLMGLDQLDEAGESYRRAIAINPDLASAHRSLGQVSQLRGKLDEAINSYRQAIRIDPGHATTHADLGRALVEKTQIEEGVASLRQALRLDPRNPEVQTSLGIALYDLDDLQGAKKALDDCLDLDPGNTHALANKAIVLHSLQETDLLRELVDFDQLMQPVNIESPSGFANLAVFNTALADFARNHPTLKSDRGTKATRNGSQTEALFPATCKEAKILERVIRDTVDKYIRQLKPHPDHPFLAKRPRRYRLSCWATVLDAGGHQAPHVHPAGWLSGVYYVRIPEVIGKQDQAGWIEFGRPDPRFYETSDFAVRQLQPVEGLMVLFPSYFWHRTVPFESQEQRISFAFDVIAES
jgi:uncharacterized protein (TIGR02466 family)